MKNLLPYVYDFLSLVFENDGIKNKVRRVILFGSVASEDFDKESDVDIFIDLWAKSSIKETEASIKEAEKRFLVISRKWSLLGIRQPIKCIVGMLSEPRWKELRLEMASKGMVLYGKFEETEEEMMPYALFKYSFSMLSQNKKMNLLRKLFGYTTVKGKKKYKQPGLLDETGGMKLSSGIILVPVENSRKVHKFLTSFGITPEIREARIK